MTKTIPNESVADPILFIKCGDGASATPAAAVKVWGRTPDYRLRRQLAKAGIAPAAGCMLVVRDDLISDEGVLRGLLAAPGTYLASEAGVPLAAHVANADLAAAQGWLQGGGTPADMPQTPAVLGGNYNFQLRKRAAAQAHIVTPANRGGIEWQLYKTSYKGVTDLVTKYVWPVPAYHVTRACARLGLSPNMVTTIGAGFMLYAAYAFALGDYGWGLVAAWIMTFLDTVDGKLARCTLTASKWGNVFDHGIDLLHPPFWYWAWGAGLMSGAAAATGYSLDPVLVDHNLVTLGVLLTFAFYILGRVSEGIFIRRFGFHVHVWRRFDSFFRLIVARRNPNLIMLTLATMLGRPDIGFWAVVLWTIIGVPVHLVQLAQAEVQRRKGHTLQSWLSA